MKATRTFNRKLANRAIVEMELAGDSDMLLQKHQTGRLSASTLRRIQQLSASDIIS